MEVRHTQGSTKEVLSHSMVQNRYGKERLQHRDIDLENLLKKMKAARAAILAVSRELDEIDKGMQVWIVQERDPHL